MLGWLRKWRNKRANHKLKFDGAFIKLANDLKIQIKLARINGGVAHYEKRCITLDPDSGDNTYVFLHEVGHLVNGKGCCNEHAEFMAHGFAMGMAEIIGLKLDISRTKDSMIYYADSSDKKKCKRYQAKQKMTKKQLKYYSEGVKRMAK